jgi:flagellar hook-length control protein FliK
LTAGKAVEERSQSPSTEAGRVISKDQAEGHDAPRTAAVSPKVSEPTAAREAKGAEKPQATPTGKQPAKDDGAAVRSEQNTTEKDAGEPDRGANRTRYESRQVFSHETATAKPTKDPQMATSQTQGKEASPSISSDGMKEGVETSVLGGGGPANSVQRFSAQSVSTSGPDTGTLKHPSQAVGDQILDSVRASLAGGERQVLVRLNPPELGSVTVRFQTQGEQIKAVLEVSRAETRYEVERAIPELVRSLQEGGVQIRRLDVVMSDQSGRDSGKEQLQQDTWTQHQDPQQQAGQSRTPFAARPTLQGGGAQSVLERSNAELQGQLPSDRIDMLV